MTRGSMVASSPVHSAKAPPASGRSAEPDGCRAFSWKASSKRKLPTGAASSSGTAHLLVFRRGRPGAERQRHGDEPDRMGRGEFHHGHDPPVIEVVLGRGGLIATNRKSLLRGGA